TEHPVMQLHRFCDAVELLTRFCTILALGELRQQRRGQALPDGLVPSLRDHLERPTFGQWKNLLKVVIGCLDRSAPLVVPELVSFVRNDLIPGLEAGPTTIRPTPP